MDDTDSRLAAVDAKQARLAGIIERMGCEGVVLFQPAHVAWFTGGLTPRGLHADTEKPGMYTNGRQRWLVSSNLDSARHFAEDLDKLGFQLKEWNWATGRAVLLGELVANRKVAADRPFPNLPPINEALRTEIRALHPPDVAGIKALGLAVAHALEAAARSCNPGESERELAGQVAHRLLRRGAEPVAITVQADGRDADSGRAGFGTEAIAQSCRLQVTASMNGLHATASRAVHFGPPPAELLAEWDAAARLAALLRSRSRPGEGVSAAGVAGRALFVNTPFEFAWRDSAPGTGTGWLAAEELRRAGQDEPLVENQAVVWQAKIRRAAAIDTDLVTTDGPVPLTPCEVWPLKRVTVRGVRVDVPDLLVR